VRGACVVPIDDATDDDDDGFADLAAYCEFDQLEILKLIDFTPFPHVVAWMERMKQVPKHDEVHEGINRFAALAAKKMGQL